MTGHSLGGALAAIAAAYIHTDVLLPPQQATAADHRIQLLTFGQPRTGDSVWAAAMDKAVGRSVGPRP